MTGRAFLETARLVLRPLAAADGAACVAVLGAYETAQWLRPIPHPFTQDHFDDFLSRAVAGTHWAIEDSAGLVGVISLAPALGYWLAPRARGQGYVTEAARAVLAAHFADPQVGAVESYFFTGNTASARVLARLGFAPSGARQVFSLAQQAQVHAQDMALTRADWATANPLVIPTPRLVLDPLTPADAEPFRALVTRPEVGRMLFIFPSGYSLAAAQDMMVQNRWAGTRPLRLAIRQNGQMIGTIGIGAGDTPDIYYFLAPEVAGQGLMAEAVAAFCPALRRHFALHALGAKVFTDNPASARLLETCGFQRVGEDSVHSAQRPAPHPVWLYRQR